MAKKYTIHVKSDIIDLVPAYIEHRKNDIISMRNLLKENKFDEIKTIGHKMKGGGSLYAMTEVTHLGEQIENASVEKNAVEIEKAVNALEEYFQNLEVL